MAEFQEISLNHVAFPLSHGELDDAGRQRILDFFVGCIDFTQGPTTKPTNLSLEHRVGDSAKWDFGSSYVVFIGKDDPDLVKLGRGGSHFGITCGSLDQFNSYLERTKAYLARYDISENIDVERFEQGDAVQLHGFYVKPFDVPISIEVQYHEGGRRSSGDQSPELALNHAAFPVLPELLQGESRQQVIDFFIGCLDFEQDASKPSNLLLVHKRSGLEKWDLGASYVVFIGKDEPGTVKPGRGGSHVGISCSSLKQFTAYLERVKTYAEKYGIPENIDIDDARPELHSFYVRPFDRPMAFEIQFLEHAQGA